MDLSIIIVNYNVKHFLEQCLHSVQAALEHISGEVLVVDNNSSDNSIEYLQPKFPSVQFIANTENTGFAKACNQGLQLSKGRYVLFLNPDTIVPEDCFLKCIDFLEGHPEIGALGIKMVDGSGKFLKESKRSFPGPITSLYKLFGLSRLFPKSKTFGRYHLGHLDENKNHEIDVMAGAFMFIRKEVLNKIGGFDETFFMYGEDVDLSFRIQKAGYKNYYFAGSTIIHFKGESTKKGSMNYVRMFYTAMSIFVKKHYGGSRAGFFSLLIHIAIWFRASLTAVGSFIRRIGLPLIDAVLILVSFFITKEWWGEWIKPNTDYDEKLLGFALPAFTACYLIAAYYAGLYDKWYKRSYILRSTATATLVLLAAYSLLPESFRFSRGIVLFGAILAFLLISICRWLLAKTRVLNTADDAEENAATVVVGNIEEFDKVTALLKEAGAGQHILGRISTTKNDPDDSVGYIEDIKHIVATIPFKELVLCRGQLGYAEIINHIQQLPQDITGKIYTVGSQSIISSNSKDSLGKSLSKENGFKLSEPYYRRQKRLIDILFSFFGIIFFPLQLFFIKKPFGFLSNCAKVISGKKTWVGYSGSSVKLPSLRKAIIAANGIPPQHASAYTTGLQTMDYWYARDYEVLNDLKLLFRHYRKLGGI